MDQKERRGWW